VPDRIFHVLVVAPHACVTRTVIVLSCRPASSAERDVATVRALAVPESALALAS
jgi:hypothetical protein